MSASEDAKAHLALAKEFLTAAKQANDAGLQVAAGVNAVWSGTHAKNAICLQLTGETVTRGNPAEDIAELAASGVDTAHVDAFDRLLQAGPGAAAGEAIGWAGQLLEAAEDVMRDHDVSDAQSALAGALWANNEGPGDGDSVADVRAFRDHDNDVATANQARVDADIRAGDGDDGDAVDSAPDGWPT